VPVVDLLVGGLDVVVDVLEVDGRHVLGEPLEHRLALEQAERAEPEPAHPVGLALHPGHLVDDVLVEPFARLEDVLLRVGPAQLVAPEIEFGRCHQRFAPKARSPEIINTTCLVTTTRYPAIPNRPPAD